MSFRRFFTVYKEGFLTDRYDFFVFTSAVVGYTSVFGDRNKPYTTAVNATVVGMFWPVTVPVMITTKVWQENKSMIIAKHYHKHKKELWADDFFIDLDE